MLNARIVQVSGDLLAGLVVVSRLLDCPGQAICFHSAYGSAPACPSMLSFQNVVTSGITYLDKKADCI